MLRFAEQLRDGRLLHQLAMLHRVFGERRALNLPGLSVSVGEMLAALERAGGKAALDLVRHERDPAIEAIVASWPAAWDNARALALGLQPDPDFDAIVRAYVEDERPGR